MASLLPDASTLTTSTTRLQKDKVIGGGVVGLATARRLTETHPSSSTLLLERHGQPGTETSSRNSEVIHAGLYYGRASLKTQLCIRGRRLLYDFCRARAVPHRKVGKWIVAQNAAQHEALERIHALCAAGGEAGGAGLDVPLRWVGRAEVREKEPFVRAEAAVLESPETGIVDAHALMLALRGLFEEEGGIVALASAVVGVEPLPGGGGGGGTAAALKGSAGWAVRVRDAQTGEESTVTAATLVNAAGLGAVDVHNMIVPPDRRRTLHYAKGNYFSYTPAGGPSIRVGRLVYPAPEPGAGGLGTHLTLDMAGRIRFGPDVEWVDSPHDLAPSADRLDEALAAIRQYLPSLDARCLAPDYAGIRPKLGRQGAVVEGKGFQDFVMQEEEGYKGWVNLLGIESPGLTSSLAIAERVEKLLYG
ncbi:FAD dependent oxidoreductase [Sodiomyces alkalinus F11]|uniref:L-2-hydroxyglutarate dehydrogenase, mitochondrial n=1 Tax=Sodiomyces alkalinus (strain CBS 110278 / VKM F-3762 / F11) TaxID=1314773 RepID=A0A3N2PW79_SODAK|nr:FAD dependent oxidoreductase [Sodiomyces alkalinus F11]ROT38763.1 FAD dependent oxidoreductase [Sodiomyces alkalinus F11]